MMARVLVVEDEEVLGKNIKRTLEKLGHTVALARSIAEGRELFQSQSPDLTLMDLRLPDGSGLDLLPELKTLSPAAIVLMMTAYATVEDAVRAIKLGARDYLQKPLHLDDLRHAVTRALDEAQLQCVVSYYREREARGTGLDALVGSCPPMQELRSKVERLCGLPANVTPPTVLITGETGTGKGLVARVMHYNGCRAAQPFIEINCAAIPENLVEAELFGHERGAFTDARAAKVGLFQAADRGTLFLDEIGCLTPAVQVKILKAIEDHTVRPVGGRADRSVDIHIIAATNSNLEMMVRDGSFREDLFYRLRVATLTVPPLRERGADVLVLARRFVAELAANYRVPTKTLSPDAERSIGAYAWPGNVRELRNTLDRAVLFSDGSVIDGDALGLPAGGPVATVAASRVDGPLQIDLPPDGVRLEEVERSLILAALRRADGNQSAAARLLGLTRDTLRYRMEKFGIESDA